MRWLHFFARRPSRGVVKRVNPAVKRPPRRRRRLEFHQQKKPACALCVCEFSLSIDRLLAEEINFLPRPLRRIHNTYSGGEKEKRQSTAAAETTQQPFFARYWGKKHRFCFLLDICRQSPAATAVALDVFTLTANFLFYIWLFGNFLADE